MSVSTAQVPDLPFLPLLCGYRGSYEPREPWLYEREFRQILTVERDSRQVVVAGRQRKRGTPVPETRTCASTACGKTFSFDPRRPRATCSHVCRMARQAETIREREALRRQVLAREAPPALTTEELRAQQRAAIARGLAETRENLRRLYRQSAGS